MSDTDDAVIARLTAVAGRLTPDRRRAWNRHVRGCTDLSAGQRLVVCALADYADYADGTNAHPGEVNLAAECGLTTRAVRGALARAQELRLIERTAAANVRTGRAAVYRLLPPPVITGTGVPVMDPDEDPITGSSVPVMTPITGTCVPVDNSITGTYASPSPERTFLPPSQHLQTPGGLRNVSTSLEPTLTTHTNGPPSRFCWRHPMGYAGRCGDCGNARTARKAWDAAAAEADVAVSAVDDLERRRRRRLIDSCPDCRDDHGRVLVVDDVGERLVPCEHPQLSEAAHA